MKQKISIMKHIIKRIGVAYLGIIMLFPFFMFLPSGGGHSLFYAAVISIVIGPAIALGRFDWSCGYSRNKIVIRMILILIMGIGFLWLNIHYAKVYDFFETILVLLIPNMIIAVISEFIFRKSNNV